MSKCYQIYDKPRDRLLQMLMRGRRQYFREFWALKNIDLEIRPGEVVGIVGQNGSGKSTLLQLVCGTLNSTSGDISVKGRIAALLELGAGFNPEFTGRENIFLSAALSGLSVEDIKASLDAIINFSGIGEFVDQPVKTYSSGMYVRLAFSVAINVDPDILVIDEALSVGDGEFSRRSFDRIMELKAAGKTILFCSHSLYQVDAICDHAVWLDRGTIIKKGETGEVTSAYSNFLNSKVDTAEKNTLPEKKSEESLAAGVANGENVGARITSIALAVNDMKPNKHINVISRKDDISVSVGFMSPLSRAVPAVGVVFSDENERVITSAGSHIDRFSISRNSDGYSEMKVIFHSFPLLKGEYYLYVFLLCEKGIHVYDFAHAVAKVTVRQNDIEQGVVSVPHSWIRDEDKSYDEG
ncbi:MAG: ABC transporter ATP-binding protein [Desulfuromusa sp.]|nr:ABC transporter ATP-binding protein [Desulfuromusa sp.]